ncbi:MAG TPA: hypothetical protein VKY26_12205, partial [Actinomycetota bacterium]|nr:hypothetical protein [Actinomycetota bacterium]
MATVEAGRGQRGAEGRRAPLTVALVLLLILVWALPAGALGPGDFTGDVTAPVLVSFSSTPASADVTSAPASFAVTMEVTDDLSGAQEPLLSYSREGSSISFGGSGILTLVSGTDLDGLWTGSFTIPAGSPAGTWDYDLSLDDNAGNTRNYDAATLSAGGFPASFTITDANSDTTGPQVTGVSGPASVNVMNGPVTVYFQVTATDAQSGVSQL